MLSQRRGVLNVEVSAARFFLADRYGYLTFLADGDGYITGFFLADTDTVVDTDAVADTVAVADTDTMADTGTVADTIPWRIRIP